MSEAKLEQILNDVLQTDYIKAMRKERDVEDEIGFYGVQPRKTYFELSILDSFFEEDIEEILKVESIWLYLKRLVEDEVTFLLSDVKSFLKEGLYFRMENFVSDKIGDLSNELHILYREQLNAEWKGLTPEQARKKLPKNQQYIALLDKNGLLTREPYPITRNMKTKLTWEIRIDQYERPWHGKIKQRSIHVKGDSLKQGEAYTVIRLKDNEVNAKIIK